MRKTLIAVILTICTIFGATAQTRLVGRVVSIEQQVIEGATITLVNQGLSTTTNTDGVFSLTYLEAIEEEVIVEAYGYMSDIIVIQLIANELTDLGDITMAPDIVAEIKEEVLKTVNNSRNN